APPRAVLPAPLLIIAVPEFIRADRLTPPPGEQPGSDRCHRSNVLLSLREKRAGLWQSPPAASSLTAGSAGYPPAGAPQGAARAADFKPLAKGYPHYPWRFANRKTPDLVIERLIARS